MLAATSLYFLPSASATVTTPVRALPLRTGSAVSLALEPGGAVYLIAREPPKGLGGGARLDFPIYAGFGAGAGYQFVSVRSARLPLDTHHAYGAITYRLDDLERVVPLIEAGGGFFGFFFRDGKRAPTFDLVLHAGGAVDVVLGPFLFGLFLRYHIFILSGLTHFPAALATGLRVGFRIFE